MPKATRRKKLKAEDFRKTKLKVGKKLAPAANQTDASFKSQSIVVPNQSLGEVKSATDLVNNRNQSFKDMIVQLRHYAAQSRKDALTGLREIQRKHADAFKTQLSVIVAATAPVMVDEERDVRKTLLLFFQDFIPTVTKDHIRPFMSLIVAYTCSSMTHISEHIRLDGLKFLTVWQTHYPDLLVMHAEKVIPNYLSMLATNSKAQGMGGAGTGSSLLVNPRSQLGGAKARVEVLESLFGYLTLVLHKGSNSWWFFPGVDVQRGVSYTSPTASTVTWQQAQQTGAVPNGATQLLRNEDRERLHNGGSCELFGAAATSGVQSDRVVIGSIGTGHKQVAAIRNTYQLAEFDQLQAFIDVLMPSLVDIWLESVPNALTPGSIALTPALSVMHTVLKMMNLMWRSLLVEFKEKSLANWATRWLKTISKHFMIHFPFGSGNFTVRDKQVEVILQDMNILYCELLSHFSLSVAPSADESSASSNETAMLDYLSELFAGKNAQRQMDNTVATLSTQQFEATFPVVWSLLRTTSTEDSSSFLRAFVDRGNMMWGTPSAISSFEFVSRLLMLSNHRDASQGFILSASSVDILRQWVLLLPKRLWQLKSSNPVFSQHILELLTYILRNNPCDYAVDKAVTSGLEASIVPFFHADTAKGSIFGPFLECPETVQMAAVTLLYYLPNWPAKLVRGFAEVTTNVSVSSAVVSHALGLLNYRQNRSSLPLPFDTYVSILLTVGAVGWTSADLAGLVAEVQPATNQTCTVFGTDDILRYRLKKQGTHITAANYWKRRVQIVSQLVACLGHQTELQAGLLQGFSNIPSQLPLDAFYGIARAVLTIDETTCERDYTGGIFMDLANLLMASVRTCYQSAANTEARKSAESALEVAAALLRRDAGLRRAALAAILSHIKASAETPELQIRSTHDVLSTLKVATRLMLGTELLRNAVAEDEMCMLRLREIATSVENYMTQPANAALRNQPLAEEASMLSRFVNS